MRIASLDQTVTPWDRGRQTVFFRDSCRFSSLMAGGVTMAYPAHFDAVIPLS